MTNALGGPALTAPLEDRVLINCRLASGWAGLMGVGVGVAVVLGGWVSDIPTLRTILSGYAEMRPNSAIGLSLVGAALWLGWAYHPHSVQHRVAQVCAGLATLIGILTLIEYVSGRHLIDDLVFRYSAVVPHSGRMAVMTAVSLSLLGGSHLLNRPGKFVAGQSLAILAGILSLFHVIGYLFGIKSFYAIAFHAEGAAMAIHTSLTLLILSAGVLLSRPECGVMSMLTSHSPGGAITRKLLPAALMIPVLLGWLQWHGQMMGLYDTAFGLALLTAANIVTFAFLILISSLYLNKLDVKRALTESNMRQLADSMPQIVWTALADGDPDYYNQRCHDYLGMTTEQTCNGGWVSSIHPDDRPQTMEHWGAAVVAGEPFALEYRLKGGPDRKYRWHLARVIPAFDAEGTLRRWIGTSTDINDLKQAEAEIRALNEGLEERVKLRTGELKESEERFRSFVEMVKDYAILTLDPQGRIVSWNSGAERIKGYTASEAIGRHFSCFYTAEDIARDYPNERLRAAAATGQFEDQGWRVRRDGSRFWAEVLMTAVYDQTGCVRGFSTVTRNITERRQAQLQLVAERERAEKANLAKSAFLAAMSHEIRTPMNAILGMADMLWESPLNPEQRQYVEVFRRAGVGLLSLINNILDLSKIEAGHLDFERVEFNLEEVIDFVIEITAEKARAKGIVVLSRLLPGVGTSLIGDPMRLRQILINLLGNAVKFTDVGEIMLTAGNCESGSPGKIEFSVSDTGIGISPDNIDTIFEDFTQADSSTTRQYGGTGLGLGISRRLVQAMGGSLSAISSVGKGSTFKFAIPFDSAPASTKIFHGPQEKLNGKRVLLIASNASSSVILREKLEIWGLKCDAFSLPIGALARLKEMTAAVRPYALAIFDSYLPGMNGLDVAAKIKQNAGSVPVVMLTSDAELPGQAWIESSGLSGVASKPVASAQLLQIICDALKLDENPHSCADEKVVLEDKQSVKATRILIAEDSLDNRLLVSAFLKDSPYQLTFEENGKAAVDRFATSDFDLILMDIQMPVMDGLAATRRIRAMEKARGTAAIQIIALTANASSQDTEMNIDAGCNAHLSKPISKARLISAIERSAAQLLGRT